jgi:hypothetical protein
MKRIAALGLALLLLFGCLTVFAAADASAELQAMKPVGDVNEDGVRNAKDVTILRRYLAGGYGITVTDGAADVNKDGAISAKDVTFLRRYLAGGYGAAVADGAGDVNKDGVVTAKDVTVLRRFLAGGYGAAAGEYYAEPQLHYRGAVTGGQLYEDLGAPTFGAEGYTLKFIADGVERDPAAYAAKIISGNTDALTADGSYTEVEKDESKKTVTVTTQILFLDGGMQYEPLTLSFTGGEKYRLLGRAKQIEDSVLVDWQADGVEFVADCGGDLYVTAHAVREYTDAAGNPDNKFHIRVIVDDMIGDWVEFPKADGLCTKLAFPNVPAGKHTIRIIKDNTVDYGIYKLLSVTMDCDPASVRASQPRAKYLEVIGASTACGAGILPTPNDGYSQGTNNTSTIVYSFGGLVATDLNMDFSAIVKGSLGITKQAGRFNAFNLPELYPYRARYRDARSIQLGEMTGTPEPYHFNRKADVIILMINENDASTPSEEWTPATKNFIQTLRDCNGADTPILILYYNGSAHKNDIAQILAEDPALLSLGIRSNSAGSGGHASGEAHRNWANMLIPLIRPLVEN